MIRAMRTRILMAASCVAAASAAFGVWADEAPTTPPTTQPALVTLHLDSMPPADAVAEFTKQTGVAVQFWPQNMFEQNYGPNGPPSSISVTVDNQPLWVALDAICGESHLQPTITGQGENITLQFTGGNYLPLSKRPASVNPNSTIVIESIQRSNSVSFQSDPPQENHSCGISLSAYIDPRIHPLNHHGATVETAVDESGKSIAVEQKNQQDITYGPAVMWKLDNIFVPLDYDPQVSHKLADFKGSIQINVVSASDKLEIADLQNAKDTEQTVAGMGVAVHEIKADGNNISVKITLRQDDMDKQAWSQLPQTIFHDVKFLTADGKTLSTGGGGGGGGNKLEYTLSSNGPSDADKPVKMVFEVPTKIEQIDLPFEFHDLTLP
jgi:hypothetical protein